jgi:hypothetical protein
MPVAPWVKELTEKCLGGPPFKIGDRVRHPDGRLVEITAGQYWGEYGLSNFWSWREVLPTGGLGPEEEGYGWKVEYQQASNEQLAQEAADWDSGKRKPTDPGWVDTPEAIPYTAADIRIIPDDPSPCPYCGRPKGTSKTPINAEGVCWRKDSMGKNNNSVLECAWIALGKKFP